MFAKCEKPVSWRLPRQAFEVLPSVMEQPASYIRHTRKNSNVAVNLYVKKALSMTLAALAPEEHLGDLALNVGEHIEDHWKFFWFSGGFQKWPNKFLCSLTAGLGHGRNPDQHQTLRRHGWIPCSHHGRLPLRYGHKISTSIKHLFRVGVNVFFTDFCSFLPATISRSVHVGERNARGVRKELQRHKTSNVLGIQCRTHGRDHRWWCRCSQQEHF